MMIRDCIRCGDEVDLRRLALGYSTCMECAKKFPQKVTRCVVPMHKSNYVLITDPTDLKGINNKGGNVK